MPSLTAAHKAKIGVSRKGKCSGTEHPRWNGGRKVVKGYVYVLCRDHPNTTKAGYILEQILVMEAHLGRYLSKEEKIHHINGNRADNRIENLQLFPSKAAHTAHHSGVRGDTGWAVFNRNHPAGTRGRAAS